MQHEIEELTGSTYHRSMSPNGIFNDIELTNKINHTSKFNRRQPYNRIHSVYGLNDKPQSLSPKSSRNIHENETGLFIRKHQNSSPFSDSFNEGDFSPFGYQQENDKSNNVHEYFAPDVQELDIFSRQIQNFKNSKNSPTFWEFEMDSEFEAAIDSYAISGDTNPEVPNHNTEINGFDEIVLELESETI
ncbi:hypothetical protein K7432_003252 [Basidiobolus ranarum]|uniref:Uncharacterized protein n=1 Tax=Basidiobolus ranarum TaxID=34480 RepID=A0ABR2X085_9FUNG